MGIFQKIILRIFFLLYNILIFLFIFLGCVVVLFLRTRSITLNGYFKRFFQKIKDHKGSFLFHFSSLGEMKAAVPLIEYFVNLKKQVVITTFTETAYKEAIKKYDNVYLLPFDFYPIVKRFINKISPSYVFITETEFWPSFIKAATIQAKVIWINARISKKSFKRYLYFSWFFRFIFEKVQKVFVQTKDDYYRFLTFFPEAKLIISGNTKYDIKIKELDLNDNFLNSIIEWKKDRFCIVFGSVHPDEFEIILRSYVLLKNESIKVKYIVVPRHIEKIKDFSNILEKYQIDYIQFSKIDSNFIPYGVDIMIFDMLGYLLKLYGISDISFVGGSLNNIGGHNLLEPAFFSKPVLFGPNYFSQKTAAESLIRNGGGFIVADEYEIKSRIKFFIFSKEKLIEFGRNANKTVKMLSGATQIIVTNLKI